jgi:hypothetical protein
VRESASSGKSIVAAAKSGGAALIGADVLLLPRPAVSGDGYLMPVAKASRRRT